MKNLFEMPEIRTENFVADEIMLNLSAIFWGVFDDEDGEAIAD